MKSQFAALWTILLFFAAAGLSQAQTGSQPQPLTRKTAALQPILSIDSGLPGGEFHWSPDGTRLAITGATRIQIYDLSDLTAEPLELQFRAAAADVVNALYPTGFTNDGKMIVVEDQGIFQIWDTLTGAKLAEIDSQTAPYFLLSPDNQTLIVTSNVGASEDAYLFQLWNMRAGEQIMAVEVGYVSLEMAVSPDGRLLAIYGLGSDGYVLSLWDLSTGEKIGETAGPEYGVGDLEFSRDGDSLLAATFDNLLTIYTIPNLNIQTALRAAYFDDPRLYFTPVLPYVVIPGDTAFYSIFDMQENRIRYVLGDVDWGKPAFSADGSLMSWGGGISANSVYVLELNSGQIRTQIQLRDVADADATSTTRFYPYAFSRDNALLIGHLTVYSSDAQTDGDWLALYDTETGDFLGRFMLENRVDSPVNRISLSPDGSTIAVSQGGLSCCGGEYGHRVITLWQAG
jgi:WD40 repeat protein